MVTDKRPTYRRLLDRVLCAVVPPVLYRSMYVRYGRFHALRWLRRNGVINLSVRAAKQFNYVVQSGPFSGMKYTHQAVVTRHSTPALLGVYERQLHPFLAHAGSADIVIDIGAAEGYYAIGLAIITGKPVVTFDCNPSERTICRDMALLNGVRDKVSIRKWCDAAVLGELVRGKKAFILSDIDGGELNLFTPDTIRSVAAANLLIEMHGESADENLMFSQRFSGTHDVTLIEHPSQLVGVERLAFLGDDAARMATEYRPFQQWIYCAARVSNMA